MTEYERCVRCGSCLTICPMFKITGEEQFSPRGKTYLLQVMDQIEDDPELAKEFSRLLFLCTLCGRCTEFCSSDVDLLKLWHEQRKSAIETAPEDFAYLEPLKDALSNVKNIYGLDPEDRAIYWLDEVEMDIPDIEDRVYEEGKTADIMVFLGCLMSFRSSQIDVVKSLFKNLEHVGADYLVLGAEEFCCGHPLYLMGDDDGAQELREHNKLVIKKAQVKQVITCCPGCLMQLSKHHELEGVEALHHTQFFDRNLEHTPEYEGDEEFAYHDPCELHRILEIKTEPRSLIQKMGIEFQEMDLSCCGGGGLLRMTDPDLSDKVIRLKAESERLASKTVITCCPSCREQLLGANLKTTDIIELLDKSVEGGRH